MRVLYSQGDDRVARVFVAETAEGQRFDFAAAVMPASGLSGPCTLTLSTLVGCPVKCLMCDAGGHYEGRLTAKEMFDQLDHLMKRLWPDGRVTASELKVQFNRMGDPAFNPAVLTVLEALPHRYDAPNLVPSLSTVAPANTAEWFEGLLELKRRRYDSGRFELQFSLHATDEQTRRRLVPVKCMSFEELAEYGRRWLQPLDRKVVLNFPLARQTPVEPKALTTWFDPERYLVKLSCLSPTAAAARAGLNSLLDPADLAGAQAHAQRWEQAGYETLLALGDEREHDIGSTCGMYKGGGRQRAIRPRRTLRR